MKLPRILLLAGLCGGMAASAHALSQEHWEARCADTGPYAVTVVREAWTDPARERTLPVRMHLPEALEAPAPVIFFSHGLGGSREAATYACAHWASHGYVVINLQHPGSDTSVWQDVPRQQRRAALARAANADNSRLRAEDIPFALDTLERLSADASHALSGQVDLRRIGFSGHSYGGWTTQAAIGLTTWRRGEGFVALGDARVVCGVALSAPGPMGPERLWERQYASIDKPCLHMTGTEDTSPIRDTTPEDRMRPFGLIDNPDQYLIVFEGGDHMVFSDHSRRMRGRDAARDASIQRLIRLSSLVFWEAHLRGSPEAMEALKAGRVAAALEGAALWKTKPGR
jgi:predicted dienelactone hydrolase